MAIGKHFPRVRLGTDLVAYYNLNLGFYTTSKVFDYSRKGHAGAVTGTSCLPQYPGFNFDGSKDYIKVDDNSDLDFGTGDFSIALWMKGTTADSAHKLIAKESGATDPRWHLALDSNGMFYFLVDDGTTSDQISTSGFTAVTDGVWHHLCASFDRDVGAATYRDSVIQGSLDTGFKNANLTLNSTHDLYIGVGWDGAAITTEFTGLIGEIMIYKKALTAAKIKGLYRQTKRFYVR